MIYTCLSVKTWLSAHKGLVAYYAATPQGAIHSFVIKEIYCSLYSHSNKHSTPFKFKTFLLDLLSDWIVCI